MKTLQQLSLILFTFGIFTCQALGQSMSSSVWVTFNDNNDVPVNRGEGFYSENTDIQKIIDEFTIIRIEQAVPDSRNESLQKVYEVECWCDRDKLISKMEQTSGLSVPEEAPEYEYLFEPDDYHIAFAHDYALDLINAQGAWDLNKGDTSILIGISDGNFYTNHEELKNKVDYYNGPSYSPPMLYYHGTAVATTAAGNTNNATGKSSIGYNCRLALITTGYNQLLQLSYLGARAVNISWSSGCYYSSYIQMIIDEIYDNGTIIVAAAGNGSTCGGPTNLVYPAAYDHVIAVSSVGPKDNHERTIGNPYTTHQHNSSVDLCAPGYDVALTVAPGWYLTGNGTSFAAPIVTGTIGLMLALRPCLTNEEVLTILQQSASDLDALNPNYAGLLGAGRLDASAALKLTATYNCYTDDGNNGHGNDDGHFDPSNPGQGHNPNGNPHSGQGSGHKQNRYGDSSSVEGRPEMQVLVYPNPSNDMTHLKWNENIKMAVRVTKMNGALIYKGEIPEDRNELILNLRESGTYYIRFISEGKEIWNGKAVRN